MNKLLLGKTIMALMFTLPASAVAMAPRVDIGVSIPLPPAIVFAAPPEVIVLPETYIYVVPDVEAEIFFYGGWWWRPWEGRWYRSQNYHSGWAHYRSVPSFYRQVPSRWRDDYRQRRWEGQPWNHRRIPQKEVHKNWNNWEKNRHWEKENTWGVKDLKRRSQARQPAHKVQPQRPRPQPQGRPEVRQPARQQQPGPPPREINQRQRQDKQPSDERQGKSEKGRKDQRNQGKDDRKDRR